VNVEDKSEELSRGVTFRDNSGSEIQTSDPVEIVRVLDEYRGFIKGSDREWKTKDGLAALGIDVGWIAEPFVFDIIRRYLYYRNAPHEAFRGRVEDHPAIWVDSVLVLDGIFGVSL
jgi:hypothetical protein